MGKMPYSNFQRIWETSFMSSGVGDALNYQQMEEQITAGYRDITVQYRRDDEVEVLSANHERLTHSLQQICRSFQHPIIVLDAGCGTGRYFHCLENVQSLTGIDISEEMLAAAANPVLNDKIRVG